MGTRVSALPSATTPLAGTEQVPIVQNGVTVKVAVSDLGGGTGSVSVTGTGFLHATAGTLDAASKKVDVTNAADVTVPSTGVVTSNGSVLASSATLSKSLGGWGADISAQSGVPNFSAGTPTWVTLASGVATFWATPSSANLRSVVTDETGTGSLVFATSPTLVTPNIGAATGTSVALSSDATVGGTLSLTVSGGSVSSTGQLRFYGQTAIDLIGVKGQTGNSYNIAGIDISERLYLGVGGDGSSGRIPLMSINATELELYGSTGGVGAGRLKLNSSGFHIQDAGGDHFLTFAVPDLAANRTLNVPLLTAADTIVTETFTQTLSNKTFVAPALGAATATSVTASGFLATGAAPHASTGEIRWRYAGASGPAIRGLDSGGATDRFLFLWEINTVFVGTGSAFSSATQADGVNVYASPSGAVGIGLGGGTMHYYVGSRIESWVPRVGSTGGASPYASDGRTTQAMADANQTLAASVYSRRIVKFTGALTAQRTATFPHPASEDASYEKIIVNDCTGNAVLVSTGTGTTVSVAAAGRAVMAFTPDGVMQIAS